LTIISCEIYTFCRERVECAIAIGKDEPQMNFLKRGITLIEVVIALGILAMGMFPIFSLLTETRRVTTSSIYEIQATSMALSMIGGLQKAPWSALKSILGQELSDDAFHDGLALDKLGIPPCYPGLSRIAEVKVVNLPEMPEERLSNPWGRVVEIKVSVERAVDSSNKTKPQTILVVKGYRMLNDSES
jgi:hypothetical protein